MEQAFKQADDTYLFPRYIRDEKCYATHASNALNKWLKKDFDNLTAHCLRHTFRDRLRAEECPMDLIDQIGGWKSVSSIGNSYGKGYRMKQIKVFLSIISVTEKY
jgi:integrase